MFTTLIFVNDTSHAIFTIMAIYAIMTVSAVNAFSTFFYMNVYTVSTIKAIYTVFTIDTNLTIFTVFTNVNGFYIKILIQCIVNSCITITIISLFHSHVFTSLEINRILITNYLASVTSMFTYFRTCSCIFCRCFSRPSRSCCTTSIQSGEIDNCFSISYCMTITIIVCQCNFLSSCIIFIYVFSPYSCTTFIFSRTSCHCCRCNMTFVCFQSIMNGFQLVFCSCLTRCKVCWIKC